MPSKKPVKGKPAHRGYGAGDSESPNPSVRYGACDAELLRECIDAVVGAGDAVILSATTDAGAYVVRVKSDSGDGCWYPPTVEALEIVLTNAANIARGL